MRLLKKILWYNMYDLAMRGKDIRLARKGTSTIIVVTFLLFAIDYCLWHLKFIVDLFSDDTYDVMFFFGTKVIGKLLGLLSFGLFYLFVFIMMGRKRFFKQTLQEYEAMTLTEKEAMAQKGKYSIVIPFALALLLLMYLLLFKLD